MTDMKVEITSVEKEDSKIEQKIKTTNKHIITTTIIIPYSFLLY